MTSNSGVQQIDIVDGNESVDSENVNVTEAVEKVSVSEVESVQMLTMTIVPTESFDSTNEKIDS